MAKVTADRVVPPPPPATVTLELSWAEYILLAILVAKTSQTEAAQKEGDYRHSRGLKTRLPGFEPSLVYRLYEDMNPLLQERCP